MLNLHSRNITARNFVMEDLKDKIENKKEVMVQHTAEATEPQQEQSSGEANSHVQRDSRVKYNKFALLGILLTIAAWITLSFNGQVALGLSVVSFISACFGLKAATRSYRNTAITAIVASAVLMVVLSAFLIVIYIGLESL